VSSQSSEEIDSFPDEDDSREPNKPLKAIR